MVITKEEIELQCPPKEYFLLEFIISLFGVFILIFSLLVFIYAPGKTVAKYGTVVDIHDYGIDLKEDSAHLHILLDDGGLVTVRKPNRVDLSKNKKVVLQETPSILGGVRRYRLYKERGSNL